MRTAVVLAVVGMFAVSACGGDDDATGAASVDTGAVTTPAPGTDDTGDDAGGTGGGTGDTGDEGSESEIPAAGEGSCRVTVSGDKQVEWTAGGTAADVASSYWFDDRDRDILGDEFVLILNCGDGSGDSLSLLAGTAADETTVPFGPGTYELSGSGAMMGDDLFAVLLVLEDSETNWSVADAGGTVTIDRFDEAGIAGTFSFTMEDSLASISGEESEGTIEVTGSFDFVNPKN
jgi:hypothetical protein